MQLSYTDGSPLRCGVCKGECMKHYTDGERNDIGECCAGWDTLSCDLTKANEILRQWRQR